MKTKNLEIFPASKNEIGKPYKQVDADFLNKLSQIDEEYIKNAKKPIKRYEDRIKSLIGETLKSTK